MPKKINYIPIKTGKKILVVGLTKNSAETIKEEISKIYSALMKFTVVHFFVIESDSNDATIEKLQDLEVELANFRYHSLGVIKEKLPLRTERIAYCRNRYLDEIKSNVLYKDIEYVIMADLDGMNDLIAEEAFLSCWDKEDWDVCTANQRGPYYDIWPLRHKDWSPNDCWSQYKFLVKNGLSVKKSKFAAVYSRMVEIDEHLDWIEVDSAFGGLAVYRRETLSGVRYVGVDEFGEEICEHLSLNAQIKSKGYRIFINPKLINAGYTRHTRRFKQNPLIKSIKKIISAFANNVLFHPSLSE
jgi:hypothetical protein